MAAGRPQARYPQNADVHGRVRESRFDTPPDVPHDPDPTRLDRAAHAALTAWIKDHVQPDPEPLVNERQLRTAFKTATGLDVSREALREVMYSAGYLSPFQDVNADGTRRFKARLTG